MIFFSLWMRIIVVEIHFQNKNSWSQWLVDAAVPQVGAVRWELRRGQQKLLFANPLTCNEVGEGLHCFHPPRWCGNYRGASHLQNCLYIEERIAAQIFNSYRRITSSFLTDILTKSVSFHWIMFNVHFLRQFYIFLKSDMLWF